MTALMNKQYSLDCAGFKCLHLNWHHGQQSNFKESL